MFLYKSRQLLSCSNATDDTSRPLHSVPNYVTVELSDVSLGCTALLFSMMSDVSLYVPGTELKLSVHGAKLSLVCEAYGACIEMSEIKLSMRYNPKTHQESFAASL